MTNTVRAWATDATGRGPSTRLWGKWAQPVIGQLWQDPNFGWGYFDDFLTFTATANNYTIAGDGTVAPIQTAIGGIVRLDTTDTANDEEYLGFGLATSAPFKIDENAGRVWFECRVRISSVTDSHAAWAVGMCEEGCSAANFLTDGTGVIADKDFVGFSVVDADADALTIVHNTAGGGGRTTVDATLTNGALTASTWVKLGFYYDGINDLTFYVNGVPEPTGCEQDDTNFPDGEELTVIFAAKTTTATTLDLDIDWWGVAQEYVAS